VGSRIKLASLKAASDSILFSNSRLSNNSKINTQQS